MEVGVLGTGAIGAGMARSLLRAGHGVRVWNRTRARAEPLAADGARVADTVVEAVRGADVVVVVVFDTTAVLDVLDGVAGALRDDAVVVSSATVGVEIDTVAATAARHGMTLVDAPVLGNRGPAERGELSVVAAGDPAVRDVVAPVLDAVGRRVTWVGDAPGPASRVKLACNAWVSILNAAMCQAVGLADGLGVDPRDVFAVIDGTAADSPYLGYKRAIALGEDDTVISPVDAIRKDLALIGSAAAGAGLPTTLVDAVADLYARAAAAGAGGQDMARLVAVLDGSRGATS